jgi:DNA-binding CsgD family transcriptional regulator
LQGRERGLTVKALAARLGCSPHTIRTHLDRIFRKLGAASSAEAVWMWRKGKVGK